MKKYYILFLFTICFLAYIYEFYPTQIMPVGVEVEVITPEYDKYKNDCLHPCIRVLEDGRFCMVESPYYAWNNKVENPIYYLSNDYKRWQNGRVVSETPRKGFNSDPYIYIENNDTIVFWREGYTRICDSLSTDYVTVGDGKIYLVNRFPNGDTEQCPILLKHNGKYFFYAVWYQYEPIRTNIGLAIWEGTDLKEPNFELKDTIRFKSVFTRDKIAQVKMGDFILFVPKPLRHDLWHFDLFEYQDKLYMVSVAEKGDNIMLSVSEDYKNFNTYQKPLINNHYSENYVHYRQYYYKPTAFIKNDSLFLFYTANAKDDSNRNQLYVSVEDINKIIK